MTEPEPRPHPLRASKSATVPGSTVGDLLLGRPAAAETTPLHRRKIAQSLRQNAVLKNLTRDAAAGVTTQLEHLLREALGDRLVDLLVDLVSRYERLIEARDASLTDPHSLEHVTLIECGWQIDYAPSVTLRLDGVPLLTLDAKVELVFRAGQLTALVRQGRLTELHAASVGIDGKLWLQSAQVAERSTVLPVALVLALDHGIPLAPPQIDPPQIDPPQLDPPQIDLPQIDPPQIDLRQVGQPLGDKGVGSPVQEEERR